MRAWIVRTAAAVVVLTTMVCVVAVAGDEPIRQRPEPYVPSRSELIEIGAITSGYPIAGQLPPDVFPPEAYGLGPAGPPTWLWWLLGAIAVAVFAWTGARVVRELMRVRWHLPRLRMWRLRRHREAPDESRPPQPAPLVNADEAGAPLEAVDAALVPLREPVDPRAAVIESYVRMEHVLAQRELGRRASEAPREYLWRVMRRQNLPGESLTGLTALFEEARFSRHPIPDSAPQRAAGELQNIRDAMVAMADDALTG